MENPSAQDICLSESKAPQFSDQLPTIERYITPLSQLNVSIGEKSYSIGTFGIGMSKKFRYINTDQMVPFESDEQCLDSALEEYIYFEQIRMK